MKRKTAEQKRLALKRAIYAMRAFGFEMASSHDDGHEWFAQVRKDLTDAMRDAGLIKRRKRT